MASQRQSQADFVATLDPHLGVRLPGRASNAEPCISLRQPSYGPLRNSFSSSLFLFLLLRTELRGSLTASAGEFRSALPGFAFLPV
jgi:hypothetical protein